MPAFAKGHVNPVFAVQADSATPTELYIYAQGISSGLMRLLIGHIDKAGAAQDGIFTDFLQALGATRNAADLTAVTTEIDTDGIAGFKGELRLKIPLAATAA